MSEEVEIEHIVLKDNRTFGVNALDGVLVFVETLRNFEGVIKRDFDCEVRITHYETYFLTDLWGEKKMSFPELKRIDARTWEISSSNKDRNILIWTIKGPRRVDYEVTIFKVLDNKLKGDRFGLEINDIKITGIIPQIENKRITKSFYFSSPDQVYTHEVDLGEESKRFLGLYTCQVNFTGAAGDASWAPTCDIRLMYQKGKYILRFQKPRVSGLFGGYAAYKAEQVSMDINFEFFATPKQSNDKYGLQIFGQQGDLYYDSNSPNIIVKKEIFSYTFDKYKKVWLQYENFKPLWYAEINPIDANGIYHSSIFIEDRAKGRGISIAPLFHEPFPITTTIQVYGIMHKT